MAWGSQVISGFETSDLQMFKVQLKAPQKEKRVFFSPSFFSPRLVQEVKWLWKPITGAF